MKYKVIGWTYYDNEEILSQRGTIGFAERNAIIDEIRKHKYLFTGYDHQEGYNTVPILNDGRARLFSQRGFGGLMAEAYNKMGDYDYASFTFYESIDERYKKYPKDEFILDNKKYEYVENESFEINVSKELFELAKNKNPFYLEDLDELRYIDEDDTLTLIYNDEKLTFLIKDIDRNKTKINFKNHHLINTEYKIIVMHKDFNQKKRRTLFISTKKEAKEYFDKAINEYNYDILYSLLDEFYLSTFINKLNKKTKSTLIKFVNEYALDNFSISKMNELLKCINDKTLYKEIAYKVLDKTNNILLEYINHYKDLDLNEDILNVSKTIKKEQYHALNILRKAIELDENNKSLRKKYYLVANNNRFINNKDGFILLMDLSLYNYVNKKDSYLINLENYKEFSSEEVLTLASLLSYKENDVTLDKRYPYYPPKFYETNFKFIYRGLDRYKEYLKNKYDLDNLYLDILMHGITKKAKNVDIIYEGYKHLAEYIYALDALSNFKYNLKDKCINKYNDLSNDLVTELIYIYE